ncbi:hypothetical protein ACJIZ3_007740 [Penstemon smallii]|uniref:Uncharacterized protein n=1 Tax=Penstemon smallii TaxID=265156 RepID=A0ABD3T7U3_9LAMI
MCLYVNFDSDLQIDNLILIWKNFWYNRAKYLMDKKEIAKEFAENAARESLIEISYRLPETGLTAENSPKYINGQEFVEPLTRDGDEKYRSELISISYSLSPDVKVLPLLPQQND